MPQQAPQQPPAKPPLYQQLAATLKQEILDGTHPAGALLPTEDELCARFSVSRHTIREALRRLRDEDLVASRRGAGTAVIPPRAKPYVQHATSINDLVAYATGTYFAQKNLEMVTVTAADAARFGIQAGEAWLSLRGLRHAPDGAAPICLTEYLINRDFAAVARLIREPA